MLHLSGCLLVTRRTNPDGICRSFSIGLESMTRSRCVEAATDNLFRDCSTSICQVQFEPGSFDWKDIDACIKSCSACLTLLPWVSTLRGLVTAGNAEFRHKQQNQFSTRFPKASSHVIRTQGFRACLAITKREPMRAAGQQQSTNPFSPTSPRSQICKLRG